MLVILGLLAGGVLSGTSLIRAAELRSLTAQSNQFITATQTFRDKYFALPGDMSNATSFWGTVAANCPGDATHISTDKTTCDGNGDGIVTISANSHENFRYWQHLANAGLIEGFYNGYGYSTAWGADATNSPKAKISNVVWMPMYKAEYNATTEPTDYHFFDGAYGNFFEVGKASAPSDPAIPFLRPEEAWNLDNKLDDGKPGQGRIVPRGEWGKCTKAAGRTEVDTDYKLDYTSAACALIIRQL